MANPELRLVRPENAASTGSKPKSYAVGQPMVRTYLNWTPALIQAAEITADGGNLRLAGNLCDWIMADDRVKGCLDTRVQSLFGLDPEFERSGDKRRSARAVRALEADEDWWDSYPEAENSLIVSWGIMLGVAPALHHWTDGGDDHGNRWLALPEFWHPQHTRYDFFTNKWMTRIGNTGGLDAGEVEIVPGDGEWILHRPYGKNRPWAMGLWRGLARLVLLKYYAESDWARIGELAVRNVVEVDKEVDTSDEQRKAISTDLAQLGRDGTIVLPPGFNYNLIELSAGAKDIYDAQIKMVNEAIAIIIRGGNLSTNVQGGSKAAAQSQKQTGDDAKLRFDAQAFTTTIHDQSLTWWSKYNFGDAGLAPWPVYPTEQEEDLKSKAETMDTAADAVTKFVEIGFEVDQEAFIEEFGLDFLKPGPGPLAPPAPKVATPAVDPSQPAQDGTTEPTPPDGKNPPPPPQNRVQAKATSGAENGQQYTDRVAVSATESGAKAMASDLASLITAVHSAGSYDEARALIVKAYGNMKTPVELARLTESALLMAQLGGNLAVREDIPELDDPKGK